MRVLLSGLLAATALLSGSAAHARSDRSLPPEERIAKALEGRVAGQPVDCLQLHDIRSTRIIDQTAILYETLNGTIYVNRPPAGADFLHDHYTLVTDTHSSQLCSVDIVRLYDTSSRMMSGTVGLGPFVPYPRVKPAK